MRKAAGDGGVLAADSLLNGADSVEACTAAALDVITAFAVPSPGCQIGQSVCSGSGVLRVTPSDWSPGLLRIGDLLGSRPFRLAPLTMLLFSGLGFNACSRCVSPLGNGGFACLLVRNAVAGWATEINPIPRHSHINASLLGLSRRWGQRISPILGSAPRSVLPRHLALQSQRNLRG